MTAQAYDPTLAGQPTGREHWFPRVIIRTLEERDLPALEWDGEYTHFRRLFADSFTRQQRGFSVLWVADLPGAGLIGQVFIQLISDRRELADGLYRAYLYSFRIKTPYRSAGLGAKMLATVEADLKQRHYQWITLNVAKVNDRARLMYERNGFRVVAHEAGRWSYVDHVGHHHQVEEPAWRMEKVIR